MSGYTLLKSNSDAEKILGQVVRILRPPDRDEYGCVRPYPIFTGTKFGVKIHILTTNRTEASILIWEQSLELSELRIRIVSENEKEWLRDQVALGWLSFGYGDRIPSHYPLHPEYRHPIAKIRKHLPEFSYLLVPLSMKVAKVPGDSPRDTPRERVSV